MVDPILRQYKYHQGILFSESIPWCVLGSFYIDPLPIDSAKPHGLEEFFKQILVARNLVWSDAVCRLEAKSSYPDRDASGVTRRSHVDVGICKSAQGQYTYLRFNVK